MKHYFSVVLLLSGIMGSLQGAQAGCDFLLKQSESHESSESMIEKEIDALFAHLSCDGEAEIVDYKVVARTISTQTESSEIKKLVLTNVRSDFKVGEHLEQDLSEASEKKQELLTEQVNPLQRSAGPMSNEDHLQMNRDFEASFKASVEDFFAQGLENFSEEDSEEDEEL